MNGYPYHQRWPSDHDGRHHCWFHSHKYGVANINDNTCNNDGCLGEDTIICWACTRWWLHSLCYWNIWVFSISFWFIFYHMCTDHYHMSFSPFDVCFLLLIVHVHNLTTCVNHNNFSTGCCTWPKFFIFSTQHNYCTYVTNWFVANDNSFILGFLCYRWLSFCSHESSLHKVLTWFLLIVCFFFSFGCVYLCFHLPCTFDGWLPIRDP